MHPDLITKRGNTSEADITRKADVIKMLEVAFSAGIIYNISVSSACA
jgi:hypothetical protein